MQVKIPWGSFAYAAGYIAFISIGWVAWKALDTWHYHVCMQCGNRWGHSAYLNAGSRSAHTCKQCGSENFGVALDGELLERLKVHAPLALVSLPPKDPDNAS